MKRLKNLFYLILFLFLVTPAEADAGEWTFAGWHGGGMYPSLVADPNQEGRLYLSSDVAGMWRSDDRGDSWSFINDGLNSLNVRVIAVAPSDGAYLYAGTHNSLLKSNNGGLTWASTNLSQDCRSICVDAKEPTRLYVGTKQGTIFSSNDAGASWEKIGKNPPFSDQTIITTLLLSEDSSKLFAFSKLGVRRYDFKENAWVDLSLNVESISAQWNEGVLYVGAGSKVAFSADNGSTWKYTNEIPKKRINRLAVISKNGTVRILAGWNEKLKGGVFLSDDQGVTWKNIGKKLIYDVERNPTRGVFGGLSRPNALRIDPFNPDIFYYTDTWGVWRSDNAGETWQEKINGAPNTSGSDIFIDAKGAIYVATMDDGLLQSRDGGASYEMVCPTADFQENVTGDVWRVVTAASGRVLATSSPWKRATNQVFLSEDGQNFEIIIDGLPEHRPKKNTMWGEGYPRALAADPFNDQKFYLGMDGDDGGGFFITEDGGKTWARSAGQPASLRVYNGLAADPTQEGRLVWGACGKGGGIYLSEDGGKEWKNVFSKMTWVFDVAVSKSGKIYAAGADGKPALYVSEDHGRTWKLLHRSDSGEAMDAILIDSTNEDRLYVGVVLWGEKPGGKILHSSDGGKKWNDMTGSLPESMGPAAMALDPGSKTLYALLYGGSVYKKSLDA